MNGRVDINATGTISSGAIRTPDISFIQNSLSDLPDNLVNPDQLLSRSCLTPSSPEQGKFFMTGSKGVQTQPGDAYVIPFSTIPSAKDPTVHSPDQPSQWKIGDPIIEPQGIYTLSSGTLVLSQPCSKLLRRCPCHPYSSGNPTFIPRSHSSVLDTVFQSNPSLNPH